ncbi:hypothetical protein XENOCAPTIV_007918 [Xenoophorus captivus]|uniref:Uncharacterized protein n=1 Tax=Xenoophorus captivus TaxID=1517983 RepID=A0ABV0Q8P1_9TELE
MCSPLLKTCIRHMIRLHFENNNSFIELKTRNFLRISVSFLVATRVGSRKVTRRGALLMQAANREAGEEVWGERQLVDPRQDNVLSGLGH